MSTSLQGRRILVVEDEFLLAEEIAALLSAAGAELIGPAFTIGDANSLIAAREIDCALLDVNMGGTPIWPVVDVLLARGVPTVLVTGYDANAIPSAYRHLPRCEKPATGQELGGALAACLSGNLGKLNGRT